MNGVEEWEAMTSAERAARLYYYAALASPTWAKEIDPRLIPFGIALREAFDTVRRQDAEKNKNADLMDTLETIKLSVANLEAQLGSKGYSRED